MNSNGDAVPGSSDECPDVFLETLYFLNECINSIDCLHTCLFPGWSKDYLQWDYIAVHVLSHQCLSHMHPYGRLPVLWVFGLSGPVEGRREGGPRIKVSAGVSCSLLEACATTLRTLGCRHLKHTGDAVVKVPFMQHSSCWGASTGSSLTADWCCMHGVCRWHTTPLRTLLDEHTNYTRIV